MKSREKLETLARIEGYDSPEDLVGEYIIESVVPGICMNPDCDYSECVEPDQRKGWCAECSDNTLCSCIELMLF